MKNGLIELATICTEKPIFVHKSLGYIFLGTYSASEQKQYLLLDSKLGINA